MGIYIKGMEMPKENELIEVRIYPNGKVSMVYDLKCEQIATATEVSEPHGRLIDADVCIDDIRNNDQQAWEALAYAPAVIESDVEE